MRNVCKAVGWFCVAALVYCVLVSLKANYADEVERNVPAAWLERLPGMEPQMPGGVVQDTQTCEYWRNTKFLGIETGAK